MKQGGLAVLLLCCWLVIQPAVTARNLMDQQPDKPETVPNTILVKVPHKEGNFAAMSAESVNDDWKQLLQEQQGADFELQFMDTINSGSWARYTHTKGDTEKICAKLKEIGVTCEPDYVLRGYAEPNDPDYSKVADKLQKVSLPATWNDGAKGNKNVKICIIDSGVQFDHPDLSQNIDQTASLNAITGENKPGAGVDDAGHGTHIAGIIGAVGNNQEGIVGVQWNADILVCKFMYGSPRGPQGTTSNAAKCIDWCRVNGAKVTSNSYGSTAASSALQDAVNAAQTAGMLFVAAAGNDGRDIDAGNVVYPAGYSNDNIISVGNSNVDDGLGTLTNWGKTSVDLFAPGTKIYSTWMASGYKEMTGTSMATPFVAGAAALIWSDCPKLSAAQVRGVIMQGVDPIPAFKDLCTTGGRLNVDKSLQLAWTLDPTCSSRPRDFKPTASMTASTIQAGGAAAGTTTADNAMSNAANADAPSGTEVNPPTPSEDDGQAVAQAVDSGSTAADGGARQTIAQQTALPSVQYQKRRVSKRDAKKAASEGQKKAQNAGRRLL